MKKNISTMALLSLFIIQGTAFVMLNSGDFVVDLKRKLERYTSTYRQEKIYIQMDKPFYQPGDIAWFNIVVLDAKTHHPTRKSDVVYAEIIDPKGSPLKKLELPLYQGTAKGDFDLPEFEGGLFRIRAYTQWSKNFPDAYLLEREIQVQNTNTTRLLFKPDFDRESYGRGESGVFEIEIKDLQNNPALLANIEYTILLDGEEYYRDSSRADIQGHGYIAFTLPEDLSTTDILINAVVSYNGVEEAVSRSIPVQLNQISLNFFPEGGDIISGENNRIAFQAFNEYGEETDIRGIIVDESGKEISTFKSLHMGMGSFILDSPKSGKQYFARITNPAGTEKLYPLAQAQSHPGLSLVSKDENHIEFNIKGGGKGLILLGHCRGNIVFEKEIHSRDTIEIETRDFPSGITVFTLFNEFGVPFSERLVYVNKEQLMQVSLKTDKKHYEPGDKVKLSIETRNPDGIQKSMKLALAVVDDKLISYANSKEDNILSYFLLSSELVGEIKEPSFYFNKDEEMADEALDLLMLTRGWRCYSWEDVMTGRRDSIQYAPEILHFVSGCLLKPDGSPVQDYIYAYEAGGDRRIIKMKTTEDGHFLIRNFNPELPLHLLCSKPNLIHVTDDRAIYLFGRQKYPWRRYYESRQMYQQQFLPSYQYYEKPLRAEGIAEDEFDFSLDSDVSSMDEVVVTGYGISRKSELSSAVIHVRGISTSKEYPTIPALQGKLAGLVVSVNPSASQPSNISFSRAKSLVSGDNIPLLVYNGFPLSSPLSKHFIHSEMFSPDILNSIIYMDSPEARKNYGSKAANGIIFIDTKSKIIPEVYDYETKNGKYSGVIITTRKFSLVRYGFELTERRGKKDRSNMEHLVYWNPEIVTDDEGKAEIEFITNDAVSSFRITAEGISTDGQLGRQETTYNSCLPISMDIKLPPKIGLEDTIRAKLMVTNNTEEIIEGNIHVSSDGLNVSSPEKVIIQPGTSIPVQLMIFSMRKKGDFTIYLEFMNAKFSDKLEVPLSVYSIGFPVYEGFSGQNPNNLIPVWISDVEEGSMDANLVFYTDVINDLESMAEALFKEPHGCFEQVSATTYPSILALQYLQSTKRGSKETRNKALEYIKMGYGKLSGYEVKGGGFEWFGHSPAHEGLTAFGLVEFIEMKKVFDGIDEELIRRTVEWLLSRKDGQGGFKQNKGKYGFSSASYEVNNAYIVYALSEAGIWDIEEEYEAVLRECRKSKDLYRMALMASAAFNRDDLETYMEFLEYFTKYVENDGLEAISADHSLVRTYGNNLRTEVLSLWITAMLKDHSVNMELVSKYIDFVLKQRRYNGFGSTQGTTLALKAISRYNMTKSTKLTSGTIRFKINGEIIDSVYYNGMSNESMSLTGFSDFLIKNKENQVELQYPDSNVKLPYNLTINWMNKSPESNKEVPLFLETRLRDHFVQLNETARMIVRLENKKESGLPMCIARIGIPGGLSLQPWQLKDYQERGLFDFYEIIDEDLVLYYKEMGPSQVIELPFDLKADIAGKYQGSASSACLYYNDEEKSWSKGLEVKISE